MKLKLKRKPIPALTITIHIQKGTHSSRSEAKAIVDQLLAGETVDIRLSELEAQRLKYKCSFYLDFNSDISSCAPKV